MYKILGIKNQKFSCGLNFLESACFSPNFFHFSGDFGKKEILQLSHVKIRKYGKNSRKLIHAKFNPLKVLLKFKTC